MRYARGFCFSSTSRVKLPPHWRQRAFGLGGLAWDERVGACFGQSGSGISVALIGRAIDLEAGSPDLKDIVRSLLSAREISVGAMQEVINRLCGRFLVVDFDGIRCRLQQDAAGMRTVYYTNSGEDWLVASHAALVSELMGGAEASEFGDHWRAGGTHILTGAYGYPGRSSAYRDVFALTPNTALDVQRGTVERVYPLAPPVKGNSVDVGCELAKIFAGQLRLLAQQSPLLVSLTSGLDSRVTLAAAKRVAHSGAEFFTYSPPTHQRDVEIALELAEAFGLQHHLLDLSSYRDFTPGFLGMIRKNAPRRHATRAAFAYTQVFPQQALHVRSNHYEIGRVFFLKHRPKNPRMHPETMQKLLLGKQGVESPLTLRAFAEWQDFVDFAYDSGYLPHDLFYWEHRMSRWCAENLCESDIAFDTWAVVNSRKVYEMMLSLDFEDRLSGRAFLEVIRQMWPELLEYPINGNLLN